MNEYIELLFFAVIAGAVLWKLSRTIGQEDQEEKVKIIEKIIKVGAQDDFSNNLNDNKQIENNYDISKLPKNVQENLNNIKEQYPHFNLDEFVKGANIAFEIIIKAYSEEDKSELKNLLHRNIYSKFSNSIDERIKRKHKLENFVVSINEFNILNIELKNTEAYITVQFISEQVKLTKTYDDEIISGNKNDINKIKDKWVFCKDLTSQNPAWFLYEINIE